MNAIRTPPAVTGANPRSLPRPRSTAQTAVRALTALGRVQFHRTCNASWPGRKPSEEYAVGVTSCLEDSTGVKGFRGRKSVTDWIQGEETVDFAVTAVWRLCP